MHIPYADSHLLIPGDAFNERQNIRSNTTGTYTLDAREWAPRASLVWKRSLCLKASVFNGVKEIEE
jgi:hypothetical protein